MADPFGLINRSMHKNAGPKLLGYPGRRRKVVDPTNPKHVEYLRAMHPDFDEVMHTADMDYKTRCRTDADFANRFHIPRVIDPVHTFADHSNSVDAVCWGPEPDILISASHDTTLKVWDAKKRTCTHTLDGHVAGVYHCAVAGNKRLILSCGSGAERNVLLWSWSDKKVAAAWRGHKKSVVHCSFSSDSSLASTADQEGLLIVHDVQTGTPKYQTSIHLGVVHGSAFCRDAPDLLCSVGADGCVHIQDIREQCTSQAWQLPSMAANCAGVKTSRIIPKAHDGHAVHCVEFIDEATIFTGGADHKMKRWDLRPGNGPKCVGQYLGHTGTIRALALSPDGRCALTGCEDGSLRIWPKDPLADAKAAIRGTKAKISHFQNDTSPPQRLEELKHELSNAKSEEERLLREAYIPALRTLNGHAGIVSGCAWHEENGSEARILSSSWDQTVRLFEVSRSDLM